MPPNAKVIGIIGASGFIGGALAREASAGGWRVVGYSRKMRDPGTTIKEWRQWSDNPDLSGLDAVVNLAGDPIDRRWTESAKESFHVSRVGVTETLVRAMKEEPPEVLVNGSAVGIYGDRGDEILDEDAAEGDGYLADLCRDWESAADTAPTRVVKYRIGMVLGSGGAAWEKMSKVFSLGIGGKLGSGQQWMPWIHIDDLVGGILHSIENNISGPVNGSAPEPVKNTKFTRELASALKRPAFLPVPAFALKLLLGDFAGALLASSRVIPLKLLENGYTFRFPTLSDAFADLAANSKH